MATVIEHKFVVTGDGNLSAKLEQSAKSATKAAKATKEVASRWQETTTAISTASIAITGALRAMIAGVEGFVKGSLEGEAATIKLTKSLQIFGGYSKDAVSAFGDYADELELVAGIQAEATLESIALGKSLGLSNSDAQQLTETAAGMSKALGVDLNTAMTQIIATFDGTSGRLGKLIPELDGMSEAQLRAGGAVELLQNKFGGFLAQTDGAGDAFKRINNAFNQMKDSVADSIFAGFDASGLSEDLLKSFGSIKQVLGNNSRAFEALGEAAADAVRFIADPALWTPIINTIGAVVTTIQNSGMVDAIKGWAKAIAAIIDNLFNHVLVASAKIANLVTWGDWSETIRTFQKDLEGMIDSNIATIADGGQSIVATFKTIGGAWESAWKNIDSRPLEPKVKVPKPGSKTKTDGFTAPERGDGGKEALDRAKEAAKLILEVVGVIDGATIRSSNQLVAEQGKALEALAEKRRALGAMGVENESLFAQAEADVRAFYANKVAEAYADAEMTATQKAAAEIEKRRQDLESMVMAGMLTQERATKIVAQGEANRRAEADKSIAAVAMQNATRLNQLKTSYEEDLKNYQDFLTSKGIADEKYFERFKEERTKLYEAESKKVQTADVEQKAGKVAGIISSASSSINGLIGTIGQMIPGWGTIIAAVVQFLNQTPEAFKKMIDGLIDAAMNVVPNLMANIPVLIKAVVESIPESIAQAISSAFGGIAALVMDVISGLIEALGTIIPQMLDINFWMDIADDAFKAFIGAFKNLWHVIFHGKSLNKALDKTKDADKPKALQYKADANAGDNKFKVKDLQPGSRQGATFEDRIEKATEDSGKGLFDYIKDAWQWVIDNVFAPIGGWIKDAFAPVLEAMGALWSKLEEIGTTVWGGVKDMFSTIWKTLKGVGKAIWDGLKEQFANAWDTFTGAGKSIWEGFKSLFKGNWGDAWDKFSEAGGKIWSGLRDSFTSAWGTVKSIGTTIWDGLWEGMKNIGSGAWNVGKKIFDGFSDLMSKFNPANLLGKLFGDKSGKGKIEGWLSTDFPFLKFAQGGFVPGSASVSGDSLANDNVAAMLSPGEYVLPRSVTQDKELMGWIMKAVTGGVRPHARGSDIFGSTVGGALDSGANKVGGAVSSLAGDAQGVIEFLRNIGGSVDPAAIAKKPIAYLESAFAKVIDSFSSDRLEGAMAPFFQNLAFGGPVLGFNGGGLVPGLGNRDSVPAMLTPGELVLTKGQTQSLRSSAEGRGGSVVNNMTLAFQGGFTPDRDTIEKKIVPPVMEALKRASRGGTNVLSPKGVY